MPDYECKEFCRIFWFTFYPLRFLFLFSKVLDLLQGLTENEARVGKVKMMMKQRGRGNQHSLGNTTIFLSAEDHMTSFL